MTLYTSKVIAQWLCLTERRVRQLRDEGVIVEARPGLYDLQPTVARYIKYLGGAGKESLNTERMKLTAEKRKAAEMDNDLRRGDLHSTQDIEKGIQTMCLNIRSRFLAIRDIEEMALPGSEQITNEAKYDKPMSASDYAKAAMKNAKEQGAAWLNTMRQGANASGVNSVGSAPAPTGGEKPDEFMDAIKGLGKKQ